MISLDTHVWFWLVTAPTRLSLPAVEAIDQADELGVSAICCWEIAMLVRKGRLDIDRPPLDWLRAALSQTGAVLLPIAPEVAVLAANLTMHGDPADRLIVATAIVHDAPLVTKDEAIRSLALVQTRW